MLATLPRFAGLVPNHAGIPEEEERHNCGNPQKYKDGNACGGTTS